MDYTIRDYANAIASIESAGSGGYGAVGPTHWLYGRPLGRYQIMEANLPSWLRAAGLPTMTGDEFLNSAAAQDAVFEHRFGLYVRQFGDPGLAAAAWFSGPGNITDGMIANPGRADVLGTTVGGYVERFRTALQNPRQAAAS